jgi:hypothetical protein
MPVNTRRPSVAVRRVGYIVAAAITVGMWFVINQWPGWQQLSFLTDETQDVLWLVNFSLVVSVALNVVYVIHDPVWLKSLGDLVTTSIGLAVLVRLWQVFPFDFSDYSVNWDGVTRIVLVVAIVGSCIGILVQVVILLRLAVGEVKTGGRRHAIR